MPTAENENRRLQETLVKQQLQGSRVVIWVVKAEALHMFAQPMLFAY